MKNLTEQIEASYESHPAFQFEMQSWEVESEKVKGFNDAYFAMQRMGAVLDEATSAAMTLQAERRLCEIFDDLESQCQDEYEVAFVKELLAASLALLSSELTWYRKAPNKNFVQLNDESVRRNTVNLFAERHFFGRLSNAAVQEILSLGAKDLDAFRRSVAAGRLTREDLSANSGPAVRAICAVLNREYAKLGVLDSVSAYMGRKTKVVGVAFELSVSQATWWNNAIADLSRPPQTLYAHLDEGISFPKSIVYLSDVDSSNGPTGCYPGAYEAMQLSPLQEIVGRIVGTVGNEPSSILRAYYGKQYHQSMNSERFRRHFMRLPSALRFNSHLGWDIFPGSKAEASLAEGEKKMLGPAGTFIVFDGARLLHRGGLIQEGERIALQVIFSDKTFLARVISKLKRVLQ